MSINFFKKTLAVGVLLGSGALAYSDAFFQFDTFNDNVNFGLVRDPLGNPAGGTFRGQIYGSTTTSDRNQFAPIDIPRAFGSGGDGYIFVAAPITINDGFNGDPSVNPGDTLFYEIRAWSAAGGSTFEQAAMSPNGFATISPTTASLTLRGGIDIPETSNGFQSFTMVPEPSTIALGIIGGLALLVRRRKS